VDIHVVTMRTAATPERMHGVTWRVYTKFTVKGLI